LNKKIASAGLLVVALSLSIATGAVTPTDEVSAPNSSGTLQVSPVDGPNGDAYVRTDDGRINVTLLTLNPRSTVYLDRLFEVRYEGNGVAEFWVEDDTSDTVFYTGESRPVRSVEGDTRSVELPGDTNRSVEIGARVDTTNGSVLTDIYLVARLPEDESVSVDPIGGGGSIEQRESTEGQGMTSVLRYDAGEVAVTVRQPEIRYGIDVSDRRVPATPGVSGAATVLEMRGPDTGETFIVTSEVENAGTATATETVELTVDGEVIETRRLELSPGERETVSFRVAFGEPGEYSVRVGDSDGITVTVYEEAVPAYVLLGIVAVLVSVVAAALTYRRRRQNEGMYEG
jgi:hypothetical protein